MKNKIGIFLIGLLAGLGVFFAFGRKMFSESTGTTKDKYEEYTAEVYNTIKANYWQKISDQELAGLYRLSAEKLMGVVEPNELRTLDDVVTLIERTGKNLSDSEREDYVVELSRLVLSNLRPFGRSGLFGKQEEDALRNRVANIDTSKNLYQTLDVDRNASEEEVVSAYREQKSMLEEESKTSTEAAKKLEDVSYAYEVLSRPNSKQVYDKTGAEPTVFSKKLSDNTFYIKLVKISQITFDEFRLAADSTNDDLDLDTLILDLRGNVGGAVDTLPYFLGPFLGNDQYAYEFFHQGENVPYKTRMGWLDSLVKFKKTVILVDGNTQSSAEIMASALKRYNVGVLVGVPTRGWGTIENTFKLKSEIAMGRGLSAFLVHSLTIGDDGQPIEDSGVKPTVDITNTSWQSELFGFFGSKELVFLVAGLIGK